MAYISQSLHQWVMVQHACTQRRGSDSKCISRGLSYLLLALLTPPFAQSMIFADLGTYYSDTPPPSLIIPEGARCELIPIQPFSLYPHRYPKGLMEERLISAAPTPDQVYYTSPKKDWQHNAHHDSLPIHPRLGSGIHQRFQVMTIIGLKVSSSSAPAERRGSRVVSHELKEMESWIRRDRPDSSGPNIALNLTQPLLERVSGEHCVALGSRIKQPRLSSTPPNAWLAARYARYAKY